MNKIIGLSLLFLFSFGLMACGDDDSMHTVRFVDHQGNTLKTQVVEDGQHAQAPTHPERNGFTFVGWSHSVHVIREDLTIRALYKQDGLMEALETWIDIIHNTDNYTDTIEIYRGNQKLETRVHKRTANRLLAFFDFDSDSSEVILSYASGSYTWYERDLGSSCFESIVIGEDNDDDGESIWNMFSAQSSRRSMIPTTVDADWFQFDDNKATLRNNHFSSLRNFTTAQGSFTDYQITVNEDNIIVRIEFMANNVVNHYVITIDQVGETTVSLPTEMCE